MVVSVRSELCAKYRHAFTALGAPERAAALCQKPSA
jgi:hypothetical protein